MPSMTPDAALIIIDMQKGICNPGLGRRNNPDAERNVQRLLQAWRQAQRPVIHVRRAFVSHLIAQTVCQSLQAEGEQDLHDARDQREPADHPAEGDH